MRSSGIAENLEESRLTLKYFFMKIVKLLVAFAMILFASTIILPKASAVNCTQNGSCITCSDWAGWIEPNYCSSSGNTCHYSTQTCGHPIK